MSASSPDRIGPTPREELTWLFQFANSIRRVKGERIKSHSLPLPFFLPSPFLPVILITGENGEGTEG